MPIYHWSFSLLAFYLSIVKKRRPPPTYGIRAWFSSLCILKTLAKTWQINHIEFVPAKRNATKSAPHCSKSPLVCNRSRSEWDFYLDKAKSLLQSTRRKSNRSLDAILILTVVTWSKQDIRGNPNLCFIWLDDIREDQLAPSLSSLQSTEIGSAWSIA